MPKNKLKYLLNMISRLKYITIDKLLKIIIFLNYLFNVNIMTSILIFFNIYIWWNLNGKLRFILIYKFLINKLKKTINYKCHGSKQPSKK